MIGARLEFEREIQIVGKAQHAIATRIKESSDPCPPRSILRSARVVMPARLATSFLLEILRKAVSAQALA
ncbi:MULTISPECIES: hypothetical protein [unclassified Caballeronia]|uniref:hypothetical protein n=1 Tax=unclassified Caballeronia TaxID=2646786 RepID=UPI0028614691|nr:MULTISPECIES: hypothetical protein [unclassified Caballeronia]MDR5772810.1 hypothetical protein [Caballeronia sp. LZ002]MDR5803767.1 hypothetical protein [Caballeronia sp. LZ001]MDR5848244.1 hypothetical protein [Caballeronia sp. LZ003]